MDQEQDAGEQIQVRFETKLPQEFHVPDSTFAVPAKFTRMGISEILNYMLQFEKPRPFDILIEGELLRTSLGEYISRKGLTTEKVLTLEYLLIPPKPAPIQDHPHEDWVTSVCGSLDGYILSGSFDNKGRIWKHGDEQTANKVCVVLEGHTEGVTSVAWVHDLHKKKNSVPVTASKDHTMMSYHVTLGNECHATPKYRYIGHSDSISNIANCHNTRRIASASWDKTIKIWNIPAGDEDADGHNEVATHQHKKGKGKTEKQKIKDRGPLVTLAEHTQNVSSVAWGSINQVISGSWDHTIKIWDVEAETASTTLNGSRVVNSITSCGTGSSLIVVSGHNDRVIRVWDPRVPDGAVMKASLSSHKGWVSCVSFLPDSELFFASASYDHSIRIWDIRATVPLHTLAGHDDKVLCVAWASNNRLLSGGADGKLRSYSAWDKNGL